MKIPFTIRRQKDGEGSPVNDSTGTLESPETLEYGYSEQDYIPGLSDLYYPEDECAFEQADGEQDQQEQSQQDKNEHREKDTADILLELSRINHEQLGLIRQKQNENPSANVENIILELGILDEPNTALLEAKAKINDLEFHRIDPSEIDPDAFEKLEMDFILNSRILPVRFEDNRLVVATCEPENVFTLEDVKNKIQMEVKLLVCTYEDIEKACEYFSSDTPDYSLDDIISDMTDIEVVQDQEKEYENLEEMAGQSPVIKFVNYVISNAINQGASDIHLEPKKKITKVRFRIDGVLFESMQSPISMHPAIVSRIKIMSNLDISERRIPQDGKISVIIGGRTIDLRVSTLPTSTGEKVVIRILDSISITRGLEQLGMETNVMEKFAEQIHMPHGILLVTGPTGSGKSTTLYSALGQMDGERLNISTVEDPVEYELDFCNQVQANERIGLTFASTLRSLLRQDPDIIMIGEIRDLETARIAVQAALTGHLVLSTLHTNDAAGSITRLVNIGIDAYLIAASVNAVLAQRLVRMVCPNCKEKYELPDHLRKYIEMGQLDPNQLVQGVGCDNCRNSGYAGRLGIYELLVIDDNFRDMINSDASVNNMRNVFFNSGADSLFDDGMNKVRRGLTTIDEVLRVTESNNRKQINCNAAQNFDNNS